MPMFASKIATNRITETSLLLTEIPPSCAPASQLSDDLLRLIFETIQQESSSDPHGLLQHAIHVASVCKKWRIIACNLSALWTCITVALDRPRPLDSLADILRRSRRQPLDIVLCTGQQAVAKATWSRVWPDCPRTFSLHPVDHAIVRDVLPSLTAHIQRWRSFVVDAYTVSAVQAALALMYEPAPRLQRLKLTARDLKTASWMQACMLAGFSGGFEAPRLRTLDAPAMTCIPEEDLAMFPELEEYTLELPCAEDDHLDGLAKTLRPLQKLRSLCISDSKCANGKDAADSQLELGGRVLLPALEKIKFCAVAQTLMDAFLDSIEAPALKTLELVSPITADSEGSMLLFRDSTDRFPSLETLVLRDVSDNTIDQPICLTHYLSLKT